MSDTIGIHSPDTAALKARTMRKVFLRIVPFTMVLYLVAFLDRVNVGLAALTMNKDVGLNAQMFGTGAAVFFVGYFVFEVPSTVIMHRVGARFWIGRIIITWGLVSAGMALTRGPVSFYVLRFLLGLAEAGFFPGMILYFSYWFPAKDRASVTGWFMAAAPIAGLLGSPLSGALLGLQGTLGLRGWQWLFLIEGAPAVLLGIATFFVLTDRPEQARWLDDEERAWLAGTMRREQAGRGIKEGHGPWGALANPRVLALALAYLGTSAGLYTVGIWAPLIIRHFGFSALRIGFLTAIPSLIAVVGMVAWARHSDRTGERHWHAALACLIAAAGMVVVVQASGSAVLAIVGLSMTAFGVNAAKPPLWTLPTMFLDGGEAAAGIGLINSLGTLGGSIGPYMIGAAQGANGDFAPGLYVVGGTLLLSAMVVLGLKLDSLRVPKVS